MGALSPGVGAAYPFPSEAPGSISARAGRVPAACVCSQELASSRDPPREKTGGLFAVWEVPSLGLSLPLSPPPCLLPPAGMGQRRLALLWSFSVPLFCKPPAVCSGRLIFSPAIPQFKRLLSGPWAGPYPKQCRGLLSAPPPPAGGRCGRLGYFSPWSCF